MRPTEGRHNQTKVEGLRAPYAVISEAVPAQAQDSEVFPPLQQFLEDEAAYLTQRSVVEFVRNELGGPRRPGLRRPTVPGQDDGSRRTDSQLFLAVDRACACPHLLAAGTPRARARHLFGDLYAARFLPAIRPPDHRLQGWDCPDRCTANKTGRRGRSAQSIHRPTPRSPARWSSTPFPSSRVTRSRAAWCCPRLRLRIDRLQRPAQAVVGGGAAARGADGRSLTRLSR